MLIQSGRNRKFIFSNFFARSVHAVAVACGSHVAEVEKMCCCDGALSSTPPPSPPLCIGSGVGAVAEGAAGKRRHATAWSTFSTEAASKPVER